MALKAQARRGNGGVAQADILSRWPALAIALLFTALFGLFSGTGKEAQGLRGTPLSEREAGNAYLAKRDPIRVVVPAERKQASTQYHIQDSFVGAAAYAVIGSPLWAPARPAVSRQAAASGYWPAPLPRAPPLRA